MPIVVTQSFMRGESLLISRIVVIMGVVRIGLGLGCEMVVEEVVVVVRVLLVVVVAWVVGALSYSLPLGFSWFCFLSLTIKLVSLKIGKILGKLVVSS